MVRTNSASRRPPVLLRAPLSLADRFGTSVRLGVLVLVLLIPGVVTALAYSGSVGRQIAFGSKERAGVTVLAPALSSLGAVVAGQQPDWHALDVAVASNPSLGLSKQLDAVHAAAKPGAATAALASALVDLITADGNSSNLILDPDLDSFYLMDALLVQLPKALLAGAQAASPSAGTLSVRIADQAVLAGTLAGAAASVEADLTTAAGHTRLSGLPARIAPVAAAGASARALSKALSAALAHPGPAQAAPLARASQVAAAPGNSALDALLRARIDRLSGQRTDTLLVSVLGFVVAGWIAAAVWWRTRTDVSLALAGVTAIAEGDLTARPMPAGRDEFGRIGSALVRARDQLTRQQQELAEAAAQREEAMHANFMQQRLAERQARQRAQTVIDETAGGVIAELRGVISDVAAVQSAAGLIDERVIAANAVTRSVVEQARNADSVVMALGGSLQSIAGMASVIAGVADQTKLLALNATIEAARAGSAGRGFSVVADEVKELAATTARTTTEISATIAELEQHAREVSLTITSMTEGIIGIDDASAGLRQVATDQRAVVTNLDNAMSGAIERVEAMSNLAAKLERRKHERFPMSEQPMVMIRGQQVPANQLDLGEGGTRITVPLDTPVAEGDEFSIEISLDGQVRSARCRVTHREENRSWIDLGAMFIESDPATVAMIEQKVAQLERELTVV